MAPRRASLPQTRRDTARARSSCETNNVNEGRFLFGPISTIASRARSSVDVGRGQQNIANLWSDPPISDSHLAQRLQGKRISHRMSQDRNLADCRIACESLQYVLQRIPRIRGALTVVAVGKHAPARRPCEEDRYDARI